MQNATPPDTSKVSKCQDHNDDTDIVNVSQRIWLKFNGKPQFQKPIVATIPLPTVPSTEKKVDFYLVDWMNDDRVDIAKTEFHMRENACEFEVDSFSGKSLVALKRERRKNNWMNDIHHYFLENGGMAKECNILIFSDPSAEKTLCVQIVESKRKEEMLNFMSNKGMVPITNAEYGTVIIQYGQIIRIDALGSIRINSDYDTDYRQIKFTQNEQSNRLRFDVDIVDAKNRAVLEFRVDKKQIYVCPFDAKKWLQHQNEPQSVGTESRRLFQTVLDRCLLELIENLAFKAASIHMVQKELFDNVTMSEIEVLLASFHFKRKKISLD
ncbi:hypothetical protein CHS0354_038961 [Potamilus streckersoni]|uniref:Uncharacterized protein n=1 Tax=Potamilus streckersoni TaxID=2493646 RepID=A0AAE0VM56_9BIVA|nr:hypothetical protein CHS0354_038961 [Potamilus streckersoni]